MLSIHKLLPQLFICSLMIVLSVTSARSQSTDPTWWFGLSGASNLNFYSGTTQRLDNSLVVPTAFHRGIGVRPYGSLLMEYRPGRIWGGMLNVAYDGRGGKFRDVIAPCNCPATLKTNASYVAIEPSLRLGFAESNFYFFAGPRVAFNLQNDFSYTQEKQPNTDSELTAMRKTLVSGQLGFGYDFPVSSPANAFKVSLSPFFSYHPYFGQDARTIESWSVTTLRAGIALKFGKGGKVIPAAAPAMAAIPVREVSFSVREPKIVSVNRQVSETLPLRNYVFFDEGSAQVPNRYVMLTQAQASGFKEEQLQTEQSENTAGRSARQLRVYHNILNILGDRLRSNPNASISLSGASGNGPQEGKLFAEAIKQYLVDIFGIDGSRIATQGRNKPLIPSEQPGGTRELAILRIGDRRVDIESRSPELLSEVGGGMMKPVQILAIQADPLDSHLIFNADGAQALLKSWSVEITDDKGTLQRYGPFTRDQESMPGKSILGDSQEGTYQIALIGETKAGLPVKKETTFHLSRQENTLQKGLRYSILFDFDKADAVAAYDKFLTGVVAPLISDGATVIIHGHTDVIGDEEHNYTLSQNRATQTQKILERALSGKSNIKFETFGFGEDAGKAPFGNDLPEERFYNRTVIIDIIPVK